MNSVYLVMLGGYEDKQAVAAYSDRACAEKHANATQGSVETIYLNQMPSHIAAGYIYYIVQEIIPPDAAMIRSHVHVTKAEPWGYEEKPTFSSVIKRDLRRADYLRAWALSEDDALRQFRQYQQLALQSGLPDYWIDVPMPDLNSTPTKDSVK